MLRVFKSNLTTEFYNYIIFYHKILREKDVVSSLSKGLGDMSPPSPLKLVPA